MQCFGPLATPEPTKAKDRVVWFQESKWKLEE